MGFNETNKGLLFCIIGACLVAGGLGLGVNWGTRATHPLPPEIVVKLLKDNGFNKVKLFEADHAALKALGNSGIEVMVGIPNDMLAPLAASVQAAVNWVNQNVSNFVSRSGVDIRYVAVGNEPFLKDYGDKFTHTTFPALQNIQAALIKAGIARKVKATIPLNADVYQSDTDLPSGGNFRADIHDLMISIVKFLNNNAAPIAVNIYPFLSLNSDPNFPVDFAFFEGASKPIVDGSLTYTNVFDANYDTLISALEKNGFPNMPVIIGEVGWPTDGALNANLVNAKKFNQGLISRILQGKGTPKRRTPPEVYIFSLIDEDAKSVDPGNFERHWGMFYYDGGVKYQLKMGRGKTLVPAKGVKYLAKKWCVMAPQASSANPNVQESISYACQFADCTSLGYGSSCGKLDARSNASYVFNMYYQTKNQSAGACNFNNMATTTTTDPSQNGCKFEIMIDTSKTLKNGGPSSLPINLQKVVGLILFVVVFTISFAP
ncbi:glucan endo-1,3-beta-glucosidase 5 [Beta vulgaris subsp. vulgaris]|uniref:glucan endo-1,3-beta-glucosidase 5 n=1 Tax=Beta vulgaris subsp. vulgaris TaxID=3555 RepID=UPI0020370A5B|nr:glucan endo-1,3-beta-glucosidase 5 [Beta vulgaris subsp. vulgaris]